MTSNLKKDEEETVFRRKLLYDGHGSGEDKRLLNIIKNVTKLCLTDESTNDELLKLGHSILKDIQAAKNAADKHDKISNMYDRTYDNLEEQIKFKTDEMNSIKLDYLKLQSELEFVEKLKNVDAYPNCPDTEQAMKDVERRKKKLIENIQKQKDSLVILSEACRGLQKVLDNTGNVDYNNDHVSDIRPESVTSPEDIMLL